MTSTPSSSSNNGTATFSYGDHTLDLRVVPATEGAAGVEISKLLSTTGLITLDPGFTNTGSTSSSITYIDGDEGILRYRGYPIEQLAQKSTFLETSYLLIYGDLPTADQLEAFGQTDLPAHDAARGPEAVLRRIPAGCAPDAGAESSAVSALSTFYQDSLDPFNATQVDSVLDPAAGQDADHRGLRLQEVGRPADALPGQQPRPDRELPLDVVSASRRSATRRTRCWSRRSTSC